MTSLAESRVAAGSSSPADLGVLFERWQRRGDRSARTQLVERFSPLARSLARRYARSSEPFEDLLQVASVGLLNAIDRFDASRGLAFTSFAVPTILGELRRYFRDCGWSVHVPRARQEQVRRLELATQRVTSDRGRPPTVAELAQYLETTPEEVVAIMQAANAYSTSSLDEPRRDGEDDAGSSYAETMGEIDPGYEIVEARASIEAAARGLPERERRILELRFECGMTQTEIAAEIGVSQMQVSRLLRRSLAELRALTGADADESDSG